MTAGVDCQPASDDPLDPVDAMLVRCLQHPPGEREDALAALCVEAPMLAAALRRRFRFLYESGMLEASDLQQWPQRIGGFRLLRKLGEGTMGVVFLAQQESLGRQVALKLIRRELLHLPRARERFRREALAASRIDHPGICAIHEVGETDGQPWLAMRYVAGGSLAAHLQAAHRGGQPPPIAWTLAVVAKVARALHVAHRAGAVHRDVKPANIQIDAACEPVLLDFGLSLLTAGDEPAMTATGDVIGTPAYLAPELIDGHAVATPGTDVYALGVVLYEGLTLKLPFAAPTRDGLYRRILAGQPEPARRLNAGVSRALEVVIAVAMERDPAFRYATAEAFADDLEAVLRSAPIQARPLPVLLRTWRWCKRSPFAATAGAALLLGLVVSVALLEALHRTSAMLAARVNARLFWELVEREPARAAAAAHAAAVVLADDLEVRAALRASSVLPVPTTVLTPESTLTTAFDLDPDGSHAVFTESDGVGWIAELGGAAPALRRFGYRPGIVVQLRFDPTGERFAIAGASLEADSAAAPACVAVFARDGTPLRTIGPLPGEAIAIAWHPREPKLVVGCRARVGAQRNALVWCDLDTGGLREQSAATWPWHLGFDHQGNLVVACGAHRRSAPPALRGIEHFAVTVDGADGVMRGHSLHTAPVFRMALRDGAVVTGGHDRRAVLWRYGDGTDPVELAGHGDSVCGVAFERDGGVVTAALDGMVRRFASDGSARGQFAIGAQPDNVLVVPETGELVVPCLDGVVLAFAADGVLLRRFPIQRNFNPGDLTAVLPRRRLLAANGRAAVNVYPLDAAHRRHASGAVQLAVDRTASVLAFEQRNPAELHIVRRGQVDLHARLARHLGGLEFAGDGRWFLAGGLDGACWMADLVRDSLTPLQLPTDVRVQQVRFSADGSLVAIVDPNGVVTMLTRNAEDDWRVAGALAGQQIGRCLPRRDAEGTLWLLAQRPAGCSVWRWQGGPAAAEVAPLVTGRDAGVVYDLDWSQDGDRIVLACEKDGVRRFTWDGAAARAVGPVLPHERAVTWSRFDSVAGRIVTIDGDRSAWIWTWDGACVDCVRSPDSRNLTQAWFGPDACLHTVDDRCVLDSWPLALDATGDHR